MFPVTVLADDRNLCGEGPVWDVVGQRLYWTDITGQKFFSLDWSTREKRVLNEGFEICSVALNDPSGFIVANSAGFWQWDGRDEFLLIAEEADGTKCVLNDCIADLEGRVLAGSCFYNPTREYQVGYLCRLDPGGRVHVLDEGIRLANGLGFSPDNRTLYFADSAARLVYAYDYNAASGTAKNRRTFVKVHASGGIPDGLTVDGDGFVWVAEWFGSCIVRYDPDGRVERRVKTPAKQTSSVAFGGPDLTDLFITSAAKPEIMPEMPSGYDANTGNLGGALYHLNLGIRGKPEYRARIRRASDRKG